jgi:hypothetical protein
MGSGDRQQFGYDTTCSVVSQRLRLLVRAQTPRITLKPYAATASCWPAVAGEDDHAGATAVICPFV